MNYLSVIEIIFPKFLKTRDEWTRACLEHFRTNLWIKTKLLEFNGTFYHQLHSMKLNSNASKKPKKTSLRSQYLSTEHESKGTKDTWKRRDPYYTLRPLIQKAEEQIVFLSEKISKFWFFSIEKNPNRILKTNHSCGLQKILDSDKILMGRAADGF